MTTQEILAKIESLPISANISRSQSSWSRSQDWCVILTCETDVKIETSAIAKTFEESLQSAWAKLAPVIETAAVQKLLLPQVDAKALSHSEEI